MQVQCVEPVEEIYLFFFF